MTEEDTAIDDMISTFRSRNRLTLLQLMEVDGMFNVSLDRFAQGRKDPQDVLVPLAEERPHMYLSAKEIEMRKARGDWEEDGDDE